MGFLNKLLRKLRKLPGKLWNKTFARLLPEPKEENQIPAAWRKESLSDQEKGSSSPGPGEKRSAVLIPRKKYKVSWLHQAKRVLAGLLLLLNFVISQFVLGSLGEGGFGLFIFFGANSFILLDYLWKTRTKKE